MGHQERLERIRESLLVQLANQYTTGGVVTFWEIYISSCCLCYNRSSVSSSWFIQYFDATLGVPANRSIRN